MVVRFIYHAVSSILSYECTTIYLTLDGNLGCSQFRATHNIAGLTFCYMSLGEYIYTYTYIYIYIYIYIYYIGVKLQVKMRYHGVCACEALVDTVY